MGAAIGILIDSGFSIQLIGRKAAVSLAVCAEVIEWEGILKL
jgi:hypothetical protein